MASLVRVGELACQKNSFLRELTATVVSCEAEKAPQGKKPKPAATGADGDTPAQLYDVVLSDSVLFPEGGGQPCDYGTLYIVKDGAASNKAASAQEQHQKRSSDGITITNVQRRGDTCVLSCPVPLEPGTVVCEVVDWDRRFDHMQHHTAQHLLTAVVERADMLHLPTISWSLTHPFCFIQVDVAAYAADMASPYAKYITKDKRITNDMVERIQRACNTAILRSTTVTCDVFDTREAYLAEQRRQEANDANKCAEEAATGVGVGEGTFRSRGIPEDVHGPVRIISLDGIDSCTCCGTHLGSLAQLQTLHLLHQETKGTTVKLYFVTGERAMRVFGDMYGRERQLMAALGGCRPEDFLDSVQRRAKDMTERDKKLKRWSLELATVEGQKLVAEQQRQESSSSGAFRLVAVTRRDDMDVDFFNSVRATLNEAGLAHVVLVAAWATDASGAAATSTIVPKSDVQGQIFITGAEKASLEKVVEVAKETMDGVKGGLSKMGFRGKGSLKEWAKLVDALKVLQL